MTDTRPARSRPAAEPTHAAIIADIRVLGGRVAAVETAIGGVQTEITGVRADLRAGATRMDALSAAIADARDAQMRASDDAAKDRAQLGERIGDVRADLIEMSARLPKPPADLPFWQAMVRWLRPMVGPLTVGVAAGMVLAIAAIILGRDGVIEIIKVVRPIP